MFRIVSKSVKIQYKIAQLRYTLAIYLKNHWYFGSCLCRNEKWFWSTDSFCLLNIFIHWIINTIWSSSYNIKILCFKEFHKFALMATQVESGFEHFAAKFAWQSWLSNMNCLDMSAEIFTRCKWFSAKSADPRSVSFQRILVYDLVYRIWKENNVIGVKLQIENSQPTTGLVSRNKYMTLSFQMVNFKENKMNTKE